MAGPVIAASWKTPVERAVAFCSIPSGAIAGSNASGTFEGSRDSEKRNGRENLRHRQPAFVAPPRQKDRGKCFDDLTQPDDRLAVVAVRGMARDKHQERRRQKLDEPDHA